MGMMDLKKKYNSLKKSHKELKQITKDELAQHIQMQKSIEAEAIYLAARKANLEEEREDLLNLLDQRDYEITMLNQQLTLQKKQNISQNFGNDGNTLGDDITNNEDIDDVEDEDEIDIIAEILDDEDIFDHEVFDDDDDDDVITKQPTLIQEEEEKKEMSQESRDKKAFDKIKEYLHLSASAVKIKYPTVRNIGSDDLIKKVKELPFYKYHDQMVKIMENEMKKRRQAARDEKNKTSSSIQPPKPTLEKRNSWLSSWSLFGAKPDPKAAVEKEKPQEQQKQPRDKSALAAPSVKPDGDYKSEGANGNSSETDSPRRGRQQTRSKKRKRSRSR